MIKINDIQVVFVTLCMLGLPGPVLKVIERKMFGLALDAHKSGYISVQGFQQRLERGR